MNCGSKQVLLKHVTIHKKSRLSCYKTKEKYSVIEFRTYIHLYLGMSYVFVIIVIRYSYHTTKILMISYFL